MTPDRSETRDIRDPELMSVGCNEVVVTFTTLPDVEVMTRVGERSMTTTGPFHFAVIGGLEPDEEYVLEITGAATRGVEPSEYFPRTVRTLARPSGALLATIATANDVHFGERECGRIEAFGDVQPGPVFAPEPGDPPYPDMMNEGAITDIEALNPDVVLVKGDLTTYGTEPEFASFLAAWSRLGARLRYVRGNHDASVSDEIAKIDTPYVIELPGVTLAIVDTVLPRQASGRFLAADLAWLDELAAEATKPILVFGHHHVWSPRAKRREPGYFGINPDDSEALIALVARREAIAGYFAGHTHRNRVRRFEEARMVPFVEVACVKDYPGSWAEYGVYEGGYSQVMRRVSAPNALAWTEKTRQMFGGHYRDYALGSIESRCFTERF